MHTLDILMSTYNGQKYVKNQIESIIAQKHDNWLLIIRDDGSCDQTCEMLNNFSIAEKRILIIPSQSKNIGVVQSYLHLLEHSVSPYFMFADQDDVWLPEKITLTLQKLSNKHTDNTLPRLVYSDLQVVDSDLRAIHPSFLKYQRLKPAKFANFRRELLQNIVTGCTLGGNAALREKALQVMGRGTESVIMHDWWLALVAFYFGSVSYIPAAPILYRQHGANQLGAKGSGFKRYAAMLQDSNTFDRAIDYLNKVSRQNRLFFETYESELAQDDKRLLKLIADSEGNWTAKTLCTCFSQGASFKTLDCSLSFLAAVLLHPYLTSHGSDRS